jgi:hypothetical protein
MSFCDFGNPEVEIRIINKDKNCIDLLKATFPGGSITGAPKVRAMEIIDELEPTRRSVYTGSIGYLGFNGDLDLNIAIRTFLVKGSKAYFQVGGAVVYDSHPEAEYQETLDKAKALIEQFLTNYFKSDLPQKVQRFRKTGIGLIPIGTLLSMPNWKSPWRQSSLTASASAAYPPCTCTRL